MKKILPILLISICSCSGTNTAIVVDVKPTDNICAYLFKTYNPIDPYIYDIDTCNKWNLGDTVSIDNIQ